MWGPKGFHLDHLKPTKAAPEQGHALSSSCLQSKGSAAAYLPCCCQSRAIWTPREHQSCTSHLWNFPTPVSHLLASPMLGPAGSLWPRVRAKGRASCGIPGDAPCSWESHDASAPFPKAAQILDVKLPLKPRCSHCTHRVFF